MSKKPFVFHTVSADWGKDLPDGDYTIGRGADPRPIHERVRMIEAANDPSTRDVLEDETDKVRNKHEPAAE